MKGKKDNLSIMTYIKGIFSGVIFAILILYILNISGIIAVSKSGGFSLVTFLRWCYENLGFSIIPFFLIALGYVVCLNKLINLLNTSNSSPEEITAIEEKLDLFVNIFFGVGVIWTAIGMRNALLVSIGSMDAETATQKGAFYILTKLVDGGILLSLSTTIIGGVGGYFMKMIKVWLTGRKLNVFFSGQFDSEKQDILKRLDNIVLLLENNKRLKT